MPDKKLHLSVLDQIAARAYVRMVHLFPISDTSTRAQKDIFSALAKSLHATLIKYPYLAGTIGPADPVTGRLEVHYSEHGPAATNSELLNVIDRSEDPRFVYAELKAKGMPPSALRGEEFCPPPLMNRRGIDTPIADGRLTMAECPIPVFSALVTFMKGGMALSVYQNHSVCDGVGFEQVLREWAENCRRERGGEQGSENPSRPDPSAERLQLDSLASTSPCPMACGEYYNTTDPDAPIFTPTRSGHVKTVGKLFTISYSRLSKLRDSVAAAMESKPSMFSTLAAYIWLHVTRARLPLLSKAGFQKTRLAIAVDHRKRLGLGDLKYGKDAYAGNVVGSTMATLGISDLVAGSDDFELLTRATSHISAQLTSLDRAWILQRLAYFSSQENIGKNLIRLNYSSGPDLFITSWLDFGAQTKWNIPHTELPVPEFIRKPYSAEDGGIIIQPRRRGKLNGGGKDLDAEDGREEYAPYEVLVQLAEDDMERLESEKGGLCELASRVVQ